MTDDLWWTTVRPAPRPKPFPKAKPAPRPKQPPAISPEDAKREYLRKWREEHPDYDRERHKLPEVKARKRAAGRLRRKASAEGHAYVGTTSARPGLFKLGSSADLVLNLRQARRWLPDYEHVRLYPGGMRMERWYLHEVFKDRRRDGEWFEVTPAEVDDAVREFYDFLKARFSTDCNELRCKSD